MKGHNFKKRNYIIYLVAISFSMAFISIFTYQLIKNNKTIDNDVILVDDNRGIKNTVSKDSDDCLVYTKYNNEVEVGYTSIEEALDVFNNKAGCTLTLNNDVTISSTLIFTKSGTLDLNGHILALQDADDIYGSVIRISSKATLNLVDSSPETTHYYIEEKTVKGTNEVDEKYRLFVVSNTKTDVDNEYYVSGEIKGGVITGGNAYSTSTSTYKTSQFNNSANGGGVYVESGATLEFSGGNITGNHAYGSGGGIYSLGNVIISKGAVVSGNVAFDGGGIYNDSTGTLTLNNGEISNNSAFYPTGFGGGVYSEGTFTLESGLLSDNYADMFGGGIFISGSDNNGVFNLYGGSIINNTTHDYDTNGFHAGAGIYYASGKFNLHGEIDIENNYTGKIYNDVYVFYKQADEELGTEEVKLYINIDGPISASTHIGLYSPISKNQIIMNNMQFDQASYDNNEYFLREWDLDKLPTAKELESLGLTLDIFKTSYDELIRDSEKGDFYKENLTQYTKVAKYNLSDFDQTATYYILKCFYFDQDEDGNTPYTVLYNYDKKAIEFHQHIHTRVLYEKDEHTLGYKCLDLDKATCNETSEQTISLKATTSSFLINVVEKDEDEDLIPLNEFSIISDVNFSDVLFNLDLYQDVDGTWVLYQNDDERFLSSFSEFKGLTIDKLNEKLQDSAITIPEGNYLLRLTPTSGTSNDGTTTLGNNNYYSYTYHSFYNNLGIPSTNITLSDGGYITFEVKEKQLDNVFYDLTIDGWTYGEQPNSPSATVKYGQDTIVYYYASEPNGVYSIEVPTEAGTYYLRAEVEETELYNEATSEIVTFVISKKEVNLTWSTNDNCSYTFTYDGFNQIDSITASYVDISGETKTLQITYINEFKDAGTYTFEAPETKNYSFSNNTCTYVMEKGENKFTSITIFTWTYGENPIDPVIDSLYGNVQITYSATRDGEYTDNPPTNAGTYYVKAVVQGTISYDEISLIETLTINKIVVSIPEEKQSSYTFTGETITYDQELNDNDYYYIDGDNSVYNAGEYHVFYKLADHDNYMWENGTVDDIQYDFEVTKAKNHISNLKLISWYEDEEGNTPTCDVLFGSANYKYSVSKYGSTSANQPTTAGTYYVKAYVDGNDNYESAIAITSFKILSRSIKYTEVDIPSIDTNVYTFNGKTQTYQIVESPYYTISNNQQKDAGTYQVVVKLLEGNYLWKDGTIGDLEYTFIINKEDVYIGSSNLGRTYTGEASEVNLAITSHDDTLKVEYALNGGEYQESISLVEIGTYEISYRITGDNTNTSEGTLIYVISPIKISKPATDPDTFYYDGNEKTYKIEASEYYDFSNNVKTNVGSYKVIISLKDPLHYAWEDGSNDDLIYSFVIHAPSDFGTIITYNEEFVYDGNAHEVYIEIENHTGSYQITYSLDGGAYSSSKPQVTNAGTYLVSYLITGGSFSDINGEIHVLVHQKVINVIEGVTVGEKLFDGSKDVSSTLIDYQNIKWDLSGIDPLTLIDSVSGVYDSPDAGSRQVALSFILNNDNYYVNNFIVQANIKKASLSGRGVTFSGYQASYDQEAHDAIKVDNKVDALYGETITYEYSLDNLTWSQDIPSIINAGTYIVYYRMSANNFETEIGSVKNINISKIDVSLVWNTLDDLIYDGKDHLDKVEVYYLDIENEKVYVDVKAANGLIDAGSHIVSVDNDLLNYNLLNIENTYQVAKGKNQIISFKVENIKYSQTINPQIEVLFGEPTYYYATSRDGTYSPVAPTKIGTYYIKAVVEETANYDAVEEITSFSIEKYVVAKPQTNQNRFTYNGEEQAYFEDITGEFKVEGNTRTDIGSQEVIVSLIDKENYIWDDGTTDDLKFEFTIYENIKQFTLLWLVILLTAFLIFEIIYISRYWKNKVRKVNSFIPLPIILASTLVIPYWQKIALDMLITAIIFSALLQLINVVRYKKEKRKAKAIRRKIVIGYDGNDDNLEIVKAYDDETGMVTLSRLNKSFVAKLCQADEETQSYYSELKNYCLSYHFVKSRISWNFDSFTLKKNPLVRLVFRGKTLCMYLTLDPEPYLDSKYKVEKINNKKFIDYPLMYRIKNPKRVRYACELIDVVMKNNELVQGQVDNISYALPYVHNDVLIDNKLIKEVIVQEHYDDYIKNKEKLLKDEDHEVN